ncbi:MAG: AAA family ATPase [Rhodobacteraceae bacterium]|nr:AAA family ATPase [Paracoccaceae bacterium]
MPLAAPEAPRREIPPLRAPQAEAGTRGAPSLPPLNGQKRFRDRSTPEGPPAAAQNGRQGTVPPERTFATSLDIYTEHFGLTSRPFALAPDPDYLFWSPAHKRAFTMLEYGIVTHAPITLITGEVGAGKTTLIHQLLRTLGPEVRVGLISNAHGSRGELLRWVLMALGQGAGPDETYVDLFSRFQDFLISEYAAGRRVVLVFDEAQNLSREALEEIRMFTNINVGRDELLQLVLVGQPELRDTLQRPDMRQFAQRVAASFHLAEMDRDTAAAYIRHRLKVAGSERNPFSGQALDLIYAATGGVPRLINRLCDLCLVYAFSKGDKTVTRTTVQQVLDDGAFLPAAAPVSEDGPAP